MKRPPPPLPDDVRALVDYEREIPPLTEPVRARALVRARAALVVGIGRRAIAPAPRTGWAAAAAVVCIVGAAMGAAAYQVRAHFAAPPSPGAAAPIDTAGRRPAPAVSFAPVVEAPSAPARAPEGPALSHADAARVELRLLRQARAAVAGADFAGALRPIAEHARRFKVGRLAEEREALRVKALAGLGRTDDARRAAAAFGARFPRSVLLPAVSRMPASAP